MNYKNKCSNPDHELYRALLTLKTPEECHAFFQDLCTVAERRAIEQRYEVARLLSEGKLYQDILEKTGASSATISRVSRCLNEYTTGAYRTVFARLDKEKP